jgi:hypothetical protein
LQRKEFLSLCPVARINQHPQSPQALAVEPEAQSRQERGDQKDHPLQ